MKIALLGYGKEGKAVEKYFKAKFDTKIDIFQNFTPAEIKQKDYSSYDIILRSPSVPPLGLKNESSLTKYFFDHCPCPIIGVTATKGKGTTCSFIKSLLESQGADVYLVGNIGTPAIEVLDKLRSTSVVVYEMSSFQLWDLTKSPHIAVVGTIEPDHLNVHKDFADYLDAKANICRYQTPDDYCIFFQNNPDSAQIASHSAAHAIPYPFSLPEEIAKSISLPGVHNRDNATAAIAAVASYRNISPDEYLRDCVSIIKRGLSNFKGLPHRLEYLRTLGRVKYYDDNFSTNPASTKVAINSFLDNNLVAIVGGRDKTDNADLAEIYDIISAPNVKKVILIGESGHELAHRYQDPRFIHAGNLSAAVTAARLEAEQLAADTDSESIVLMSPAAASFDMFKNVYDRGEKFQQLVADLD